MATTTTTVADAEPPRPSATRTRTVTGPDSPGAVQRAVEPSVAPRKLPSWAFHTYVSGSPSGSFAVAVSRDSPPGATSHGSHDANTVGGVFVGGVSSSSVMVSETSAGPVTPVGLVAAPDTRTVLSAASTALSTPVMVTRPVLAVLPAAIVSVLSLDRVKSSAAAGATGAADTVIVVSESDASFSVAVTLETPPFSEMEVGDRRNVTAGTVDVPSSSVMVSETSAGPVTPEGLAAAPDTRTVLSASSTALSTPVMATRPVLVVLPAAIVSVLSLDRVKSSAAAGATGAAETVIVVSASDASSSVAVTLETPPFSEMEVGDRRNVTAGTVDVPSSSVMVSETRRGPVTPLKLVAAPDTRTVLSASSTALSTPVMVTCPVLVVLPAAIVSVLSLDRVKSSAAAGATGVAETVIVVFQCDASFSVAVTLETPPFSEMEVGDRRNVTTGTLGGVSSSSVIRGSARHRQDR